MEEIGVYIIYNGAGPSSSRGPDTDNSVSKLVLSNNLSYNLCFLVL